MLTRGGLTVLLVALLSACSPAPKVAAPARVDIVPCGEPAEGDSTVAAGHVAFVGDTVVITGEAKGVFVIEGQARRCPSSPSILVLGLRRTGAARFAWCVASPAPFASLAVTPDGFAVAGRMVRDAGVAEPVILSGAAASAPAPAGGAEEIGLLRFAADGTLRGHATLSPSPGPVAALASLPDGALVVEGSAAHVPPRPFLAEHFLMRVEPQGTVSELEERREVPQGSTPVVLVRRPGGGLFRAAVERNEIVVEILADKGERRPRARVPAPGIVVDLVAAAGEADDELWLAWGVRLGRGEPARWQRSLARVGKGGNVNERSLGHEALDAHVQGLVPLAQDRAAVLFQVTKASGQEARFGALVLPKPNHVGAAALIAYEVPGTDEIAVAALGDDVTAQGVASDPAGAVLAGSFRGALRAPSGAVLAAPRCGLFVGTVAIDEARWRR